MPRPNPNLLLVEGVDDQHVVYALCKRHALPECFEVVPPKGVQRLLQAVPERLQESDRQRVGLVLDADTDVKARWTSVRNLLIRVGYDPPLHPDPAGTVIASPDPLFAPTVGIWLMPDNQAAGTLEDFLERLVPERDALFTRARHAVAAIPRRNAAFRSLDCGKLSCTPGWPGRRSQASRSGLQSPHGFLTVTARRRGSS